MGLVAADFTRDGAVDLFMSHLTRETNTLFLNDGRGLNGCYATHIVLRPGTHVLPVPEALPDSVAAPANCALATIVNALEILPDPCDTALVQGGGLLGIYACAWLRHLGVANVYCTDLSPQRLELVSEFGGIAHQAGTTLSDADLVLEVADRVNASDKGRAVAEVQILFDRGRHVTDGDPDAAKGGHHQRGHQQKKKKAGDGDREPRAATSFRFRRRPRWRVRHRALLDRSTTLNQRR